MSCFCLGTGKIQGKTKQTSHVKRANVMWIFGKQTGSREKAIHKNVFLQYS